MKKKTVPKQAKRKRPNPAFGKSFPKSLGDPFVAFAIGLIALVAPHLANSRICRHKKPVKCPTDKNGKLIDWRCLHFGHTADMCHECYCMMKSPCLCVAQYGVPCPPDCRNYGRQFDGCHNCDCLGGRKPN